VLNEYCIICKAEVIIPNYRNYRSNKKEKVLIYTAVMTV